MARIMESSKALLIGAFVISIFGLSITTSANVNALLNKHQQELLSFAKFAEQPIEVQKWIHDCMQDVERYFKEKRLNLGPSADELEKLCNEVQKKTLNCVNSSSISKIVGPKSDLSITTSANVNAFLKDQQEILTSVAKFAEQPIEVQKRIKDCMQDVERYFKEKRLNLGPSADELEKLRNEVQIQKETLNCLNSSSISKIVGPKSDLSITTSANVNAFLKDQQEILTSVAKFAEQPIEVQKRIKDCMQDVERYFKEKSLNLGPSADELEKLRNEVQKKTLNCLNSSSISKIVGPKSDLSITTSANVNAFSSISKIVGPKSSTLCALLFILFCVRICFT